MKPRSPIRRSASRLLLQIYTAAVFAFIFMPLVTIAVFSFNADRFPSLPWAGFSLTWYQAVFADPTIARGLANSLIVAAATAIISTLLGIGAAYVDYRYRFVGKGIYTALMTLPPTIPVVILGLAMLTFEGRIGITGTLSGIVAGHVVLCMPFALALVRLRLADLDPNLEAASWNLGATRWTTMRDVIIPFCRPAIIAALFLTAAISFDEFMIAWFISGLNETLPVRLLAMLQGQVSPRINAVGTMVFSVSIGLVVLAQLVIGRRLRTRAAFRALAMAPTMLELDRLEKRFGNSVAVADVSFSINKGEFIAVMGPSGCGKTTTLRMIAGLDKPTAGEIRLWGRRLNEDEPWEREAPLVWQNYALFPFLSVRKNVEFGLKQRGVPTASRKAKADEWLERLGITELADRAVDQLSGGQRQRVALARCSSSSRKFCCRTSRSARSIRICVCACRRNSCVCIANSKSPSSTSPTINRKPLRWPIES